MNFKMCPPFIIYSLISAMLIFTSGCKSKNDDPEPVTSIQLTKLTKTWKLIEVTVDGTTKKSDYLSFELVIDGVKGNDLFSYSVVARPSLSPWPQSGSWSFGTNPESEIVRDPDTDDEITMQYEVTENTLQISFEFSGEGYASRTRDVGGEWVFTFGK
jgi:hypothetical protein